MGRVDEAMRRAAQASARVEPAVETPPAAAVPDPDLIDPGLQPIDLNERRRARAAAASDAVANGIPSSSAVQGVSGVPGVSAVERERPASSAVERPGASGVERERPVRTERSAEAAALLARLDPSLAEKIVVDRKMEPGAREQYRRLAAGLYHQQAETGLKVLMIASAGPSEGKTLTAVNLGLTLSESYRRSVLLIDADLRRPSLHTAFRVPAFPGLSEGLGAGDDWKMPLHEITGRMTLLTGGKASTDPMSALTSSRMRRLIDEARDTFNWVILDTPPIGLMPDANLLASMVDGAILVVKAGDTPYDYVRRATDAIGAGRILGVVLNKAVKGSGKYGYSYDYGKYYAQGGSSQG